MVGKRTTIRWQSDLAEGRGVFEVEDNAGSGQYTFQFHFARPGESSVETRLSASYASNYAVMLVELLRQSGFAPQHMHATAQAQVLPQGMGAQHVVRVRLDVHVNVAGLDGVTFDHLVQTARERCREAHEREDGRRHEVHVTATPMPQPSPVRFMAEVHRGRFDRNLLYNFSLN